MAPEVLVTTADGRLAVTNAADVYMYGCFLIEILTGGEPWWWMGGSGSRLQSFRHENLLADPVSEARKHGAWNVVVQKDREADKTNGEVWMLEQLISLCLRADPASRPTMDQVVDSLAYAAAPRGEGVVTARVLQGVIYSSVSDFEYPVRNAIAFCKTAVLVPVQWASIVVTVVRMTVRSTCLRT